MQFGLIGDGGGEGEATDVEWLRMSANGTKRTNSIARAYVGF